MTSVEAKKHPTPHDPRWLGRRAFRSEPVPLLLPLLVALALHLLVGCGDEGAAAVIPDAGPGWTAPDGAVPPVDGSTPPADGDVAGTPTLAVESAAFTAYGRMELTLAEALPQDAAFAVVLDADHGYVPAVSAIERVGDRRYELSLDSHHLPVMHTVIVAWEGQRAMVEAFGEGARVAFVTREHGSADLSVWNQAGGETGLAAADAICQSEAEAAGYRGTFRAFIGGPSDPACRMLGSEGRVSEGCGLGELPADTAAVLDATGTPVFYGLDGLLANEWRIPLSRHADGEPVGHGTFAWYAANADGTSTSSSHCAGWTGVVDEGVRGIAASSVATLPPRAAHAIPCDTSDFRDDWTMHLFCVQTATESGGTFFATGDMHRREGKQVFLTSTSVPGDAGVAAADAVCNRLAADAGLDGQFAAWLSDGQTDAYCHVLGLDGKRAEGCGGAAIPESGPWVRTDGYLVASDIDDLTDTDGVAAPVLYDELGAQHVLGGVLTGTKGDGTHYEGFDCDGWTGTGSIGGGHPRAIGDDWTRYFSGACYQSSVICFER